MEVGAHYRQVVRATHSAQITTFQTVDIGLHRSLGRVECALHAEAGVDSEHKGDERKEEWHPEHEQPPNGSRLSCGALVKDSFPNLRAPSASRSEEHTSELQSH